MTRTMKQNAQPQQQSSADSFFGMALAQTFMGFAFGPCAEDLWVAGETLSAVYVDRCDQKRADGRGVYELGKKKSLADSFARFTENTVAEMERMAFRPSYAAPSLSL